MRQDSTQPGYGYAYNYGAPFLPRPPETFTSGAFGPMSPILPVPVDQPPPGATRPEPRRWQPYVGYNLPVGTPGTEGYKLASFATLQALGNYYSIMRTCLEIRKNEIRALDWEIALTPDAAKAYRGDRAAMRDFGERKAKVEKFFKKPDPNYDFFSSWLYAAMEQVFVYDALTLYLCPTRGRGTRTGVLGSGLDSLWLIDGSSIRPLMGLHGERPAPPAPSFQQFEFAVPRADLMTMRDGRDLEESGLTADDLTGQFRGDQLLYLPYVPRADTPYGLSLVEQAIIPIMTGLRKQAFQLSYFDESTIPAVYISPGDVNMTANQIRELQDALNAIAGDIAWRYKVIVLPPGSKTMPQKDIAIVDQSDEWIATEVCMVANINPMEVGILPRVSTVASPFAAREMAQAQRSIHARTSTKPTLKFLTDIADLVIQQVLRQRDMRFLFSGMEEEQDLAAMTDMKVKQVQSALSSVDEARDVLGIGPPWGTPETSGPVIFTAAGPLPLGAGGSDSASDEMASEGALTDAHAASQGAHGATNGSAAAAGTSGRGRMNGPVTQRQRRRGGSLAPAHATAEGSPGHSGGPSAKAAGAELEALARHLRKGMAVTAWQPRHIPGHALAVISEDLAKGLTPDQAVGIAKTMILGAGEYAWMDTAGQSPKAAAGSQQQNPRQQAAQALAQQYATRIRQAFATAITQAAKLIARWAAGTLTVTLAVLVAMIANLVRKALLRVLRALWRKAWKLGREAAQDAAGGRWKTSESDAALAAFLAAWGEDLAGLISQTRMIRLQEELTAAIRAGQDPQDVATVLGRILGTAFREDLIAASETTRAMNYAALQAYKALGVAYKMWETRRDGRVCQRCRANQDQGPVPLDAVFSSGDRHPGAHPRCRCWLAPWFPRPLAAKAMRQRVALNGERYDARDDRYWASDEDGNAAGGGGRGPVRHLGDGTQVPGGVPGDMFPGGDLPRWDASEPFPRDRDVGGGHDDEQGGERGTGTPATAWPSPHYMDGYWPQGGHGTQQAPMSSPGAATGRPPNSVGKAADAASFLRGAPKAKTSAVYGQLEANYPPDSIAWVKRASWHGPSEVPLSLIDWSGRKTWAADKQTSKVGEFARQLRAREHVNPVVAIAEPGKRRLRLIDGHHRALACRELGWPVRAWIARVDGDDLKAAWETHSSQVHQGDSPGNKSFTAGTGVSPGSVSGLVPFNLLGQQDGKVSKGSVNYRPADPARFKRRCGTCSMFRAGGSCTLVEGKIVPTAVCDRWESRSAAKGAEPYVAGLMVRAADTGRVLMLQRSLDDDQDHAAGKWEPPGGHAEPGETLLQTALREWSEETGMQVPRGSLTGSWDASNGIYRGFVITIPAEDSVPIFDGRDQVWDPDDPKGDHTQACAWFDPAQFADNPSMRPEMADDLDRVLEALASGVAKSAETPIVSTVHHPLGHEGLWHTPSAKVPELQQLPAYHQNTARALMRDEGMGESQAIAMAINAIREWKAGRAFGGRVKVTPEVQAAAARADAEFEQLRAAHH